MRNYIFISKIEEGTGGNDYTKIEESFGVFKKIKKMTKYNGKDLYAFIYKEDDFSILLIHGRQFKECFNGDYLNSITKDSYTKLIDNVEKIYEQIKINVNKCRLKDFTEVFKPSETIICIHWGGSTNNNEAMNKEIEKLRKSDKKDEIYSITYFSSQDLENGKNVIKGFLVSKDKQKVENALEFYKMRANNLLVKKKIYEVMESIFIYSFADYLKTEQQKITFCKTKDRVFYKEINSDLEFLRKEQEFMYKKDFINAFFNLVNEDNDQISVNNIKTLRSDTYKLVNEIEGPIYPKAL